MHHVLLLLLFISTFSSLPFFVSFLYTFYFIFLILDRFRHFVGNRNKKIATPSKRLNNSSSAKTKSIARQKCLNNVINQHAKTSSKNIRNMTKVSSDNLLIDECGNVVEDELSNNINDNHGEKILVVDVVDEWMRTFAFLSREFFMIFFIVLFFVCDFFL